MFKIFLLMFSRKKKLDFPVGTAQKIELEKIPDIFKLTEDFPEFLKDKT